MKFRVVLKTVFLISFFSLALSFTASALTIKSGKSIASNNGEHETKAPKLVIDIVNRVLKPSELTDEQLCLSLKYLDSVPTYYEMKSRGLDCLHISKTPENWSFLSRDEAFRFLKEYQQKYDVIIPKFSLEKSNQKISASAYLKTLKILNPTFSDDIKQSINNFASGDDYTEHFCLDWYPQIAYIANDQSKNLDGTISWKEDTLRDGFVICQGHFSRLVYLALENSEVRSKVKRAIENWIDNGTPHREQDGYASFMYPYLINRIFVAIELLHTEFNWTEDRYRKARQWMKERAYEIFPGDRDENKRFLTLKCELNKKRLKDRKSEVCQNGGIIQAQALLRAGIFARDREMVELAFVAFHRYMSGIREDGSNASDSRRGCTAADYNNWASEFMSDFIYLWSQISEPLWEHSSFGRGTPARAIEYSISLFDNWEKINVHTVEERWEGCGDDKKNQTQEAGTKYKGQYSKLAYSPYLAVYKPSVFIEELAHYRRFFYTSGSGIAYEVNLLASSPELIKSLLKYRKENQIEPNFGGFSDDDNSDGQESDMEAKTPTTLSPAIQKLGLIRDNDGYLIKKDVSTVEFESPSLKDYRPPKKAGWSARYRVKFKTLRDAALKLDRKTIAFWRSSDELTVRFWMEDLFEEYPEAGEDWKLVYEKCGEFVDDNELYDLEIPIKTDWEVLNKQFECVAENVTSPVTVKLIGLLTYAADNIDFVTLKP